MIYLPHISQEDYDDFRNTLKSSIPDTYEGWLSLAAGWRAEAAPDEVKDVRITADQFRRYLFTSGRAVTIKSLKDFAKVQHEQFG